MSKICPPVDNVPAKTAFPLSSNVPADPSFITVPVVPSKRANVLFIDELGPDIVPPEDELAPPVPLNFPAVTILH